GKITSANNTSYGTIHINLASVTDVAVNINADIENTGSGGRAIYLSSTRAVNIAGGRIEAKGTEASRAINSASAVITISGSAVITAAGIGTSLAIYQTSGTINVNGGTVSATGTGMAIYQTTGTTNVNGGMVSAASGYAIQNNATGTVNIKGGTVTSSISSATSGTIYNASTGKLNISGGTITNGATGTSIYNAIYNASTGLIVLDGNPDIGLSAIRTAFGTLSVAGTFAPGTLRMYALELVAPYALGSVAVTDGGSYAAKFIPNNFPAGYGLAASGSDVVIVSTLTNGYAVEGIYPSFSITKGSGNHHDINSALISIRNSCGTGTECSIQFGDGTEVLGIGTDSAIIDGTWGKVNLTGKITSANNSTSVGTIYVNLASGEDLAVNINADIENTGNTGRAIYLVSDRAVNITGGKIKATGTGASRAIISNSTAVLTISGNAEIISAGTSYTIYQTTGTINIFGGIIEAASDIAVFNATAGSIVLGNNPVLNGFIRTSAQRLSVVASGLTNEFAPVAKTYSLDFAAYAENSVAVLGGKDFLANFKLTNSNWKLVASGNDLVLVEKTEADFEEEACVAAGNTWVGGQCKTSVQLAEEACVAAGNTWVGGQCKTSVQLAEEACVAAGNTWVGGQCKTSAQLAEEACLAAGNTWVDGQCKTSVQLAEEACVAAGNTWIGGQCKTSAQLAEEACVAAGNTWVNNACVTTPVQKGRMFANNLGILKNGEGFLVQGLSKPETVRIFDMQGKVLMSKTVMPNENVSISHLPKGIYLVNVNGKSFKLAK
ncbi:MAG: T9SS type A sorting domain-containing protein, partial [Fibromonadales bacterium]|nr:T9SS type A sorting domain-containing protein [Fibromonadales bacterium]